MSGVVEGLVSTIIPVYNRPQMLREAVASVLAQTYRPIEIIISDDGSTDGAADVADELARRHPEARVAHNPNRGPGPAREAGRLLARGEFIQYLDSDDLLLPRKFEIQVAALRRNPECGAAYGYIRLDLGGGRFLDKPYKGSGHEVPFLFPRLLVERWWNTNCPLYRRSVCDAAGPWPDLRYSEDWEYDARIGALRTRLAHCKEYVTVQRQHGGPRETGHGRWLAPPDRVRFFRLMLQHARAAGVDPAAPEMSFFAKWVFLNARQSAALGHPAAAESLFQLALETAGRPDLRMRVVRLASRLIGWRATGKLCAWRDRAGEWARRRRA